MHRARTFVFEPFRLDVVDERLWRRTKTVRLGHKALAVLQRLVSEPGQLVTKGELLAAAWPDTAVSESVLTTAMRELRRALGDRPRAPRFVETVHGRGYRFIAPVAETSASALVAVSATTSVAEAVARRLVGREVERAQLAQWYAAAQRGTRRIGFVAGEAGIGKSVLVEAFVSGVAVGGKVRVARGQCIEQYGAGEAYLPVLEALARLGHDVTVPMVDVLRDHAPSWLAHLPSLVPVGERELPAPVSPERMLREIAEALEILTARDPLILVLEDLHWSDTATLEWLACVARRRDPARLLVLGTYRPVEALLHRHPLRNLVAELRRDPQCAELVLDYLSREAVEAYVGHRCGAVPRLGELVELLLRRTGGHPLFLATIVDELERRRALDGAVAADLEAVANLIPTSVRRFIEHRFEQLSEKDQAILEAASATGERFSVAAVAAGTSFPEETIEARCAAWAGEGGFFAADGTSSWPDGTLAARFRFRHALFQEAVYARTSPERRARLHRRIGRRLEEAHGRRATTIAAELAMHLELGRDPQRALGYLEQAARNALQRSAYSEARRHLTHGLELLDALPEGRSRLRQELELSLLLGQVLTTTKGWGVEEVERVYRRARELCAKLRDEGRLLPAVWGSMVVSVVRAELRRTRALSEELLRLAKKKRDPIFRIAAHMELGGIAFTLGEPVSARKHFQQSDRLYDARQHRSHVARFGVDVGLFSRAWEAHFLWHSGYPDRARARSEETLALARKLSHPFSQTVALAYATMLNAFRRDVEAVQSLAEATIAHSAEHGFPYYLAWAEVLRGWSRALRGFGEQGLGDIHRGLDTLRTTAGLRLPYYRALQAEACGWHGRIDEARDALAEALDEVERTEERWWEAELHRLRGEIFRSETTNRDAEAEACFRRAIDVARTQEAKMLELRASVSLGRLWRDSGRRTQAHRLVLQACGRLTEGFDTADLMDARALAEELAS